MRCRIASLILIVTLYFLPQHTLAHRSPTTIMLLNVSPGKMGMELQIPLSELEPAYGNNIRKNPKVEVLCQSRQLQQYLLAHIHPTTADGKSWRTEVTDMRVEKAVQELSGPPFQEITVHLNLTPPANADTREFVLNYNVIMHQVVTHNTLVSIRNDWETGNYGEQEKQVGVIRVDTRTSIIYPLKINLGKGSW